MKADWILFVIIGFQMCTLDFLYFQNFILFHDLSWETRLGEWTKVGHPFGLVTNPSLFLIKFWEGWERHSNTFRDQQAWNHASGSTSQTLIYLCMQLSFSDMSIDAVFLLQSKKGSLPNYPESILERPILHARILILACSTVKTVKLYKTFNHQKWLTCNFSPHTSIHYPENAQWIVRHIK